MSEAEMQAGIAQDMRARGLDPSSPRDRELFEAEIDAIMVVYMRSEGLRADKLKDLEELARRVDAVGAPGPRAVLH